MSYRNWNDYFQNFHDNRKDSHTGSYLMEDIDRFEFEYKYRFGMYTDYHAAHLAKQYGYEEAWNMVNENIKVMNQEKLQAYDFQAIPDDVIVPF